MLANVEMGVGVNGPPVETIPGRECGECTVCCIDLTIDDPELQKAQGFRCSNLASGGGCGIYPTRPHTCRTFNCAWRQLKWIKEGLRPDRSGVLVRFQAEVSQGDKIRDFGIVISLRNTSALRAEGLAETVAAAVANGIPLYLNVQGPPGQTAAVARINEALTEAVLFKDKALILDILRRIRSQGRRGPRAAITFKDKPRTRQTTG